ncbi:response regulator [Sphingobacterium multivorum]|uniref:Response regulator n=1 Tax=Sphingobacterium multivorum TaxID=28454 RepID=A0ABX7CMC9_SPHMU|nr:response regulator [Sphingobacterium multivorum]QQT53141.1 response regulator [Sphingobacterium multivorum]
MQPDNLKSDHSKVFSVLHADSDLLMRKIIANVFSNTAFQLDSAANGREAFAFLEAKGYQYDIVITEMHMQYANGYEIVNKVIKESPNTKTIITSNMSYLHIREGLEIIREDCFKKPLVVGKLLERVKYIVDQGDKFADQGDRREIDLPILIERDKDKMPLKIDLAVQDDFSLAPLQEDMPEQLSHKSTAGDFTDMIQDAVVNELAVAEFVAQEEMLSIDVMAVVEEVLAAPKQTAEVISGKRWW